jgi:hypothetical protein
MVEPDAATLLQRAKSPSPLPQVYQTDDEYLEQMRSPIVWKLVMHTACIQPLQLLGSALTAGAQCTHNKFISVARTGRLDENVP